MSAEIIWMIQKFSSNPLKFSSCMLQFWAPYSKRIWFYLNWESNVKVAKIAYEGKNFIYLSKTSIYSFCKKIASHNQFMTWEIKLSTPISS